MSVAKPDSNSIYIQKLRLDVVGSVLLPYSCRSKTKAVVSYIPVSTLLYLAAYQAISMNCSGL